MSTVYVKHKNLQMETVHKNVYNLCSNDIFLNDFFNALLSLAISVEK